MAPISKARAAVLARLREATETLSVDQLAAETGQHSNTAREHLEALVSGGHATKTAAPKEGRGRPAWMYRAVGTPAGPVGYAALAAALAQHIADHSANPAAEGEAAGRAWARALPPLPITPAATATAPSETATATAGPSETSAATCAPQQPADKNDVGTPGTRPTPGQKVRNHVVQALEQAGFGVERNAAATELTLTTCPIVEAARENPEVVCAVHLGLVREVMSGSGLPERQAKLLPFAGPGFCTLRLPADPVPDPGRESAGAGHAPVSFPATRPAVGTP